MSFTVSLPGGAVQLSGNPINVVATTTTMGKTNHFMLFHIVSTDGAVPHGPWTESMPVAYGSGNGSASIDIHSIVDTEFNYTFNKDFNNTAAKVYTRNQLAANFTIKIGERYIDENGDLFETDFSDSQAVIATTTLKVLKGGFSNAEYAILTENGYTFQDMYMTNVHFLTRWPKNRILPRNAWLKLWFTPAQNESITLTVTGWYSGTDETTGQQHTFNATTGNMYEINTNLDVWPNITATLEGKPLNAYTVNITNGSWYDEIYITLEPEYQETVNFFHYANSLGGIDLLYCTGNIIENAETAVETFTRALPISPKSTDATKVSDRKTIGRSFKINTGTLSLPERQRLYELLASQMVLWQTDKYTVNYATSNALVPVTIKPGSFQIDDSSGEPQDVTFEFEIAHTDKY